MNSLLAQERPRVSIVAKGWPERLTLALEGVELVEQRRDVDDHTRSDERNALLVDQAYA